MILTDTPQKEFLKSCKKVQKAPNGKAKNTKKRAIGDYVRVEFKTFPRKYYVGRITKNKDFEGDYEISYMRKKRNVTEFFFPEVTDLASVKEKDIRAVLPAHKECGSTSRQRSSLKFDCDFFFFNVH